MDDAMDDAALPVRAVVPDSVRTRNLSAILRLVHRSRGISRSALATSTGLNRSTIAALVGELVDRELVFETDPESRNRVGRPSPVVQPAARPVGIAVNPEIDAVTIAVVGLGGEILQRERHEAAVPSADEAVALSAVAIERIIGSLGNGHTVVGVGVAVPGLVRARDGLVKVAPHLGWVDAPFAEMLSAATGLTVDAANDANLGVRAESIFGSGRGVDDIVYLNGGASGIGGGVISGGLALGGADGYAGELGHTLVNSAGGICHCGATGCLETEVRRSALLDMLSLSDAEADQLEERLATVADPAVGVEVRRQLGYLATAIGTAANVLNPRLIVLGGFLSSLYAVDPEYLDQLVSTGGLRAPREGLQIARAQLGTNILLIGAAELAFESILADPLGI